MFRVVVNIHGAFYVNLADNKHKHKHKQTGNNIAPTGFVGLIKKASPDFPSASPQKDLASPYPGNSHWNIYQEILKCF